MADKLKFLKGDQSSFNSMVTKDGNTFYHTTDTNNLYLGNIHLNKQNVAFGTCMTRSDLAEKEIVITDSSWTIAEGAILFVQFAATNSASNPQFKINNQLYSVYTARGNEIIDLDGLNPEIYTQGGDETQILSYVYHNNAFYCQADEPESAKVILFTFNSCSESFANVTTALMSQQKVYFFLEVEDEDLAIMANLTFCGILDNNVGLLFATHIPGLGEGMLLFGSDESVLVNAIKPGSITIGTDTWSEDSGAHTDLTNAVNALIQNYKPNYYGVCSTAASIATKEVTISGYFKLEPGAMIVVKFTNANSASTPTLNVNNTGAKPLYRYGTTKMSSSSSTTGWTAGAVQLLVYDGTGWIRTYWANSTYSNAALGQGYGICETAEATLAKTVNMSSYALGTGGIVAIRFINKVPANSTLNINSKGAKSIYYRNAAITNNVIQAGDTITFIYNGAQYHLLSNDRWEEELRNLPQHGDEFSITDDIIHLKQGNGIVVNSTGVHHKDTSSQANITAADGKYISGLTFDEYGHVTGATAYTNGLTTNGGSLVDGKTLTFSQYGNRYITISGNSIAADMSHANGGWAGAFASVKHNDPDSTADDGTTTTTLLGWYGGATDLTHIFMGGTYSDPAMKMTKNGYFTFKYRPKVGTTEVALTTDIPTALKNPNSLIFTGASTETYDGSSEVSVNLVGWAGTGTGAEIFNYSGNVAKGNYSHANGWGTQAIGNYSSATGYNTVAFGDYSHAEGYSSTPNIRNLSGDAGALSYTFSSLVSVNIGDLIYYNNIYAVVTAFDSDTKTVTLDKTLSSEALVGARVQVISGVASGKYSHKEGMYTGASGNGSHAEGYSTYATGNYSHAEGDRTKATGECSHAEGMGTEASGSRSHTEGHMTKASALAAHAEGIVTNADGSYSHTEGYGTTAKSKSQHVQGEYNIIDTEGSAGTRGTYAHIIGNGTQTARSNAHTLDWSGNAWFAGDVYVGSTSGTNKDAGSQKLTTITEVNTAITNAIDALPQPDWIATVTGTAPEIVLAEQTLTFSSSMGYNASIPSASRFDVVVGEEYDVYWNDVKYTCTVKKNTSDSELYLGQAALAYLTSSTTETEPFCISSTILDTNTVSTVWPKNQNLKSVKLLITKKDARVFNVLPRGYLPETVVHAPGGKLSYNDLLDLPTFTTGTTNGTFKVNNTAIAIKGLAAAAYKAVTDSSSASAISTGSNLVTERDVYYGLPTINNAHNYTSNTTIYAPTSGGTAGYVLRAVGTTSAPAWEGVQDSSSAQAISTGANLVTERDIYYGLPTINNSHAYTSSTKIYAPTAGGTAGQVLIGKGATTAPGWDSTLTVASGTGVNVTGQLSLDNAVKFVYNNNDKCVDVIFI